MVFHVAPHEVLLVQLEHPPLVVVVGVVHSLLQEHVHLLEVASEFSILKVKLVALELYVLL